MKIEDPAVHKFATTLIMKHEQKLNTSNTFKFFKAILMWRHSVRGRGQRFCDDRTKHRY